MADQQQSAAPEKAKSKLHLVLGRLFHNGKFFRRGSNVTLTPTEAKPLIAAGAVKPAAEE